jgi:hypothetical protein
VDLPVLSIEQEPREGRERKRAAKGRVFSSRLVGYLAADRLWDAGSAPNVVRPVFLAYLGTERELQPFTANLRAAARAKTGRVSLQLPKKARFRWLVQKQPQGLVITVAYLPSLFHLDPPVAADHHCFVSAPPRWWVDDQVPHLRREFGEEAREVARAAHFCAFLDRRSTLPLLHDLRFHLHLYRAALEAEWVTPVASASGMFLSSFGLDTCGLEEPLACLVAPDELDQFVADQTSAYFEQEIRHGSHRFPADRRLLSLPATTALQLRLDLDVA